MNEASGFFLQDDLDHDLGPSGDPHRNQQYRVDLLTTSAGDFPVAPGDVLDTIFRTDVGDPLALGPTLYFYDLRGLPRKHKPYVFVSPRWTIGAASMPR